jgi:hypothetical protein
MAKRNESPTKPQNDRKQRTAPLGEMLRGLVENESQRRGVLVAQVLGLWPKICPLLAAHSVPLEVRGTTFRVAVASDAVKQEMMYLAPQILDAVNMVLGYRGVTKLATVTRPLGSTSTRKGKVATPPPPASAIAKAAAQCKSVPDEALRNALQGLGSYIYREKKT